MHWRRKWQPTPVFLPGESWGQGSLVGCHLWGHTELDTTEATYLQNRNRLRDTEKQTWLPKGIGGGRGIHITRYKIDKQQGSIV